MKILIVAPLPTHSTYDVFKYYVDAMQDSNDVDVVPFNYHTVARWHIDTIKNSSLKNIDDNEISAIGISRAARELLLDIIIQQPDVVHFISALAIPASLWQEIFNLRDRLKKAFAISIHFTESPYSDKEQINIAKFADVVFLNDKYSVAKYDPNNNKHIYYLPHSYNPKVHNDFYELDDEYKSDVFFTATPFRERGRFLASINWNDINFKLGGPWAEYSAPEDYLKLHKFVFTRNAVPNVVMARYYAGTKIALNIHRVNSDIDGLQEKFNNYADAYSIGPRVFEAVACKSLVLTDFRQEAVDIFGDTLAYFDTAKDVEEQIKLLLNNAALLEEKVQASFSKIENCTFLDRLNNIMLPVFEDVKKRYLS